MPTIGEDMYDVTGILYTQMYLHNFHDNLIHGKIKEVYLSSSDFFQWNKV